MTVALRPAVSHAVFAPRAHAVKTRGWASQGSSSSPAYISLSRDHVALFKDHAGNVLTPIDLGRMRLSTQQAWELAADSLLAEQTDRIEFTVRNSCFALGVHAPYGLEAKGDKHPPATWLAHPRTFKVLHEHFTQVLEPQNELVFLTRDHQELFVLDACVPEVRAMFKDAAVLTYSLGFPLNYNASKR